MEEVMAPTIEKERLVESVVTNPFLKPISWNVGVDQHINGDQHYTHMTEDKADAEADPYRYGWRYIQTTTEDGEENRGRIGLTLYDLLHPQMGDFIVETTPHGRNIGYVSSVSGTHLADDSHAFVFSDLRTDLNLPGIEPICPDVAVIFDIAEKKDWSTFDCQEEGTVPAIVFEMTSPSTREQDFDEKYDYYRQAGIPFYVILDIKYDKNKQVRGYTLLAHELVNGEYIRMDTDVQGRYWLPPLGLWIGLDDDGILCYDARGNLLLNHEELSQALTAEQQSHSETTLALADAERHLVQAVDRTAEQERIAKREAQRAAEQERIAKQETQRAVEQEQIAKQETERAEQAALDQQATEAENARLRALIAQLGGEL